jgi:hypothetical protein
LADGPSGDRAGVLPQLAPDDAILLQLLLRGPLGREQLLVACGGTDAILADALAGLVDGGLVAHEILVGREVATLTAAGRSRAAAVVQGEAALLGPTVAGLDAAFVVLNRRVKEILLRWQVRVAGTTEVPNDHRDSRYDALVVADLRAAHGEADRLLARLAPLRARYASLRQRLAAAIERASAGERGAVAGVTGDSFHGAWWELHGDLLAMLGRARGADDV